jgi:hypothetical protein
LSGEDEEFYDLSSPSYPQQGDIFPNLPLISPPPSRHLVILRNMYGKPWEPSPGPLEAIDERLINAFDDSAEYIAVSADRGLAAILTQTCDLVDQEQWLICPLLILEGSRIDAGNLFAGKFANLFGMRQHPVHFEGGFLDLTRCFPIRRNTVELKDRIASLSHGAQHALNDKLSETLTRVWGFSPGEAVPKTGKYRCVRCFHFFDVKNDAVDFQVGQRFTDCDDCLKISKHAQWRLLRKHKKY